MTRALRVAFVSPAMGQGGGHLSRAIAVWRALVRSSVPHHFQVWSGEVPPWLVEAAPFALNSAPLVGAELLRRETACTTAFAASLAAFRPDVVLVDTVWLPVQETVRALELPSWLMLRWVPPVWLRGPRGAPFDASTWSRVIAIEPWPYHLSVPGVDIEEVSPVVTSNPDECVAPGALHGRLGLDQEVDIALIAQTGADAEVDHIRARALTRASSAHFVTLTLRDPTRALVPLAPWLREPIAIWGGCGYNLYWECRWMGVDSRATLTPLDRNNDNQRWRADACRAIEMRANGADELVAQLRAGIR